MPRPLGPLARFRRDARGGVAVVTALALVVLLGAAGAAVDFARSTSLRAGLDAAADRAALAAAREAQVAEQAGASAAEIVARAKAVGEGAFRAAYNPGPGYDPGALNVEIALGASPTARVTYAGEVRATMTRVLGFERWPLGGQAVASFDSTRPLEVYLVLDTSASMQLGATQGDIDKLEAATGCAFACHDGNRRADLGDRDRFEWALATGVQLRFQAVNAGVRILLDHIRSQDPGGTKVRVALYGVNEKITKLADLTGNLDVVKAALPTTLAGQSHLDKAMPALGDIVGAPGLGPMAPRKLVIIATDGVNNAGGNWHDWETSAAVRDGVDAVDGEACRAAFKPGVQVAVLHTPYLPLTGHDPYDKTLDQPTANPKKKAKKAKKPKGGGDPRIADVEPELKACATGAGLYLNAFDAPAIQSAALALYQAAAGIRLTQ